MSARAGITRLLLWSWGMDGATPGLVAYARQRVGVCDLARAWTRRIPSVFA